jgi:hypothetical protein
MIPSRFQFGETRLAHEPAFSQAEPQKEMEETFLKLYDLLEQYAPPWYSDQLREEAESVLRQKEK